MVETRHGKEYTFWHPFQVRDPELRQLFSDSDMISDVPARLGLKAAG